MGVWGEGRLDEVGMSRECVPRCVLRRSVNPRERKVMDKVAKVEVISDGYVSA